MRASRDLRSAAEHGATQLRSHGRDDVEILQYPADGTTVFGS
jgi:hypothetical protein